MIYVVEHPSVADDMGKAGAERVRKEYSWGRFFEMFDRGIKAVMQTP